MFSIRLIFLIFMSVFIISSCTENTGHKKELTSEKQQIKWNINFFNPLYIDEILDHPNQIGAQWENTFIDTFRIKTINLFTKGGIGKNGVNEKYAYSFTSQGAANEFYYYNTKIATSAQSISSFQYEKNNLQQINVFRFLGTTNNPPIITQQDSSKTIFIYPKSGSKNDTTFLFPTVKSPDIILKKVGDLVESIEVIQHDEFNLMEMMKRVSKLDSSIVFSDLTLKTVTILKNSLPQSSYVLNEKWERTGKLKAWYYANSQLIKYEEFLHQTLVKTIEIEYDNQNLPVSIIQNRKKFNIHYSFY
jgi:hypothetical protein